jgi:hypothetical protein
MSIAHLVDPAAELSSELRHLSGAELIPAGKLGPFEQDCQLLETCIEGSAVTGPVSGLPGVDSISEDAQVDSAARPGALFADICVGLYRKSAIYRL